jgi:hypothetical protein
LLQDQKWTGAASVFEPRPVKADQPDTLQSRLMRHEILLCLLGGYTFIALVIRAGLLHALTLQTIFVVGCYGVAIVYSRSKVGDHWQKLRFFAGYLFVLWYFLAVASFVPALGLETRDVSLLAVDEHFFGVTPAVWMQSWSSTLTTELMSGCYLSYLVYLHVAIVYAAFMSTAYARRFASWILSVYAIGLPGYLLVPATGPANAFPDLFSVPLDGWLLTQLNQAIVERGSAVFDVFPSLHVLITCALLDFDRRFCPRRFKFMLLPAAGIFTSALYLRYHYAIDLLAGAAMFLLALMLFADRRPSDVATGN